MPISPEREALIWRLVNDEWDDESELASFFTSVCDPAELHMLIPAIMYQPTGATPRT